MHSRNAMFRRCFYEVFSKKLLLLFYLSATFCLLAIPKSECAPAKTARQAPNESSLSFNASAQHDSEFVAGIMRLSKAAEMLNYMNESIDPCENFYNFACGNWAKINPANSVEHITTGLFESMTKALDRKMVHMLQSAADPLDTDIDKMVRRFYKSCTKMQQQGDNYKLKLRDIIAEFGEMPALVGDDWQEDEFDWLDTIARIGYKYGASIILSLDILPDYTDNKVNRLYIGQQEFLLESRAMYSENFTAIYRDSYRGKIESELKSFLSLDPKLAKKTAREILDFETDIAAGMVDVSQGLDVSEISVLRTVEDMQRRYAPTIDIAHLVEVELGESLNGEPVYEFGETYFSNLIDVVKKTPKRIIANYIYYMLLGTFTQKPAKTEEKQSKMCISTTKKYFAKILDNMIYRRYNNKETEHDVKLIWNELKATFKALLESGKLGWIKRRTLQYALKKLDAMQLDINSYVKDNFTEEFGELVVSEDDYIENVRKLLQLGSRQAREELHQPPKPIEAGELLSYTPANIILENRIRVPVSLLQPYYLWANIYPNALKFGTLASLIGHELIHGFDDSGRKFDKDGNNHNWWDNLSTEAFVSRTECFSEQYSHYVYNGRFLSKNPSQSENIADNGGVKLAYAAYLKWYEEAVRSGRDMQMETLPTVSYTSKQLFFISYAQVWCNDTHPRVRDLQTSIDEHVPGKYRVIGPLSNFDEFAKEFNCIAGTRMNPLKKCEIY